MEKRRLAKSRWVRKPFHGGSAPNHGTSNSQHFPEFGAPKPRPLLDRHTRTSHSQDLENPKDYRLLGGVQQALSLGVVQCVLDPPLGARDLLKTTDVSRKKRMDGFHGSTVLGRRAALGAEPQNHRESNHGETKTGNPFWGLNAAKLVWPNHGGFEALSWGF